MSGLEKLRLTTESTLRKVYRELEVLTAEDDYDAVASGREHLKSLYLSFRSSHSNYHVTLQDEVDIKNSNAYLYEVQQQYIEQQKAAKAALNDMRPQQAMNQEYSQEQSFKTLGHLINLPSLELRKFSGEPEEFDDFLATFNEVIGNVVPDPAAKLVRLKSQVTGVALDSIKMCRTDSGEDGYNKAMKILRERFGSPYIVCTSVIERLIGGPDVRSPSEMRTFSDELSNAEVTLKKNNMYTEIVTQNNIIQICLRLEPSLRYEWRSIVMKNKQSTGVYLKFSDFVIFVQELSDVVNDPLYGNDALVNRPIKGVKKKCVTSLPIATQGADMSMSNPDSCMSPNRKESSHILCHLCAKNHKLYACYKFRSMPIDKRCDYVKTNNLCILCLSKDHSVSECRSTYMCRINDCGKKHSSSLHVYDIQPATSAVGNSVQTCDTSNTYMPTVPVLINDTLETFALLDTGSSTSFCSRRLIKEMKLKCTNTSYQLKTLHGTNNKFSKTVNLQVSSRDGLSSLEMNNVIVIDEIPVERCSFDDVSRYPHLKDLTFAHASRVDLLIGQDYSAALIPIEVRHGPINTPFAVRTMMGWNLNGRATSDGCRRVTSNCISTTCLEEDVCHPERTVKAHIPLDTFEMFLDNQMSVSVDRPQSRIPWKRSLSVKLDKLHFTPIGYLITLYVCLILFIPNLCLCCTAMLSNISRRLKHYMLQWGECYLWYIHVVLVVLYLIVCTHVL